MRIAFLTLLLLLPLLASAQSFTYELYEVGPSGRKRVAEETVNYDPVNLKVTNKSAEGMTIERRELLLPSGFSIGCSDYGDKQPKGFGCWLSRIRSQVSVDQYNGFSWEWYDRGVGTLYEKRQGGTKVNLKTVQTQHGFAMDSIEFLEEAVFRVNVEANAKPGIHTHELIIKGGSMLFLREQAQK